MQATFKSYATAGAALAAASVIAITPVAPPLPEAAARTVSPAVALSATFDPITPWLEVFNESEVNIAALADYWLEAPFPVAQQIIANSIYYITHLSTLGDSLQQILENIPAGLAAPFAADPALLDTTHSVLFGLLQGVAPEDLQAIIGFTASPMSGILVGLVGTLVSPILALCDSIQAASDFFQAGETVDGLNALNNITAAMTGAYLNGYGTLDLSALIPVLQPLLPLGTITELNLAMGGLLNPAGSLLNSLGVKVKSGPITLFSATGVPAGLIGSMIAATNAIAEAIGWDGSGNPLAPPLSPPYTEDSELAAADEVPALVADAEAAVFTVDSEPADAPIAEAEAEVAVAVEAEAEVAAGAETEAEAEAEVAAEVETEAEAEAEVATETEAEAEAEVAAEVAAEVDTTETATTESDADGGAAAAAAA